jgi:hypothetical protein
MRLGSHYVLAYLQQELSGNFSGAPIRAVMGKAWAEMQNRRRAGRLLAQELLDTRDRLVDGLLGGTSSVMMRWITFAQTCS